MFLCPHFLLGRNRSLWRYLEIDLETFLARNFLPIAVLQNFCSSKTQAIDLGHFESAPLIIGFPFAHILDFDVAVAKFVSIVSGVEHFARAGGAFGYSVCCVHWDITHLLSHWGMQMREPHKYTRSRRECTQQMVSLPPPKYAHTLSRSHSQHASRTHTREIDRWICT